VGRTRRHERRAAAAARRLALLLAEPSPNDYTRAFDLIARERSDALIISQAATHYHHRRLIAEFAARNRLPSMGPYREFVEAGGLMSYGTDLRDIFRRIAIYVDSILKGAKPADLPIQQPTKFELVINLKTAKALSLNIPQSLLLRADKVSNERPPSWGVEQATGAAAGSAPRRAWSRQAIFRRTTAVAPPYD
jgi:putative ABC transport system substrate-binding protein